MNKQFRFNLPREINSRELCWFVHIVTRREIRVCATIYCVPSQSEKRSFRTLAPVALQQICKLIAKRLHDSVGFVYCNQFGRCELSETTTNLLGVKNRWCIQRNKLNSWIIMCADAEYTEHGLFLTSTLPVVRKQQYVVKNYSVIHKLVI